MKKRNEGFTLIELMVTILVASIVMAAATSVLLMYMRMQKETKEVSDRVNNVRVLMYVLESVVAEEEINLSTGDTLGGENGTEPWELKNTADTPKTIVRYENGSIYIKDGQTPLIEDLDGAEAKMVKEDLLALTIYDEEEEYTSTIYCRRNETFREETTPEETTSPIPSLPAADAAALFTDERTTSTITPNYFAAQNVDGREAFLAVLMAEEGSTGASRITGEYFSEWYIGSYENNPDWSPETPWCACYISWALDRCSEYLLEVPRYAHVDQFMASFDAAHWRTLTPHPGDIIFFDWIVNDESIPQHVGVVLTVENDKLYTIEGNTEGKVAVRSYAKDDPRILGCGVLNWK